VWLFLLADLVAGKPVLPSAGNLNGWLAALGMALTIVFAFGMIVRPRRCYPRLGIGSVIVIVIFGLGIAGLFAISHG
jgi:cation:H+ antiporter